MSGECAPLPAARASMRGDERVVLVQLDLELGGADPEPLADQSMRARVVGPVEDDLAVGVEFGLFPLGQLQGVTGSGCSAGRST